jgi:predicted tellurium resistance membrane protein TerC
MLVDVAELLTSDALLALAALTAMEVVLGIDNVVFRRFEAGHG